MATDAQIRANRMNAKRSTGARTPEGKERAKLNAVKHGLTAKCIVLPWEDMGDYFELHGALLHQYQPENPAEMFLVDQVAQNWWRLNRSRRFETGMLAKLDPENAESGPSPEDLDQHRRYEAAIERSFYRAYDRLERIVRRRPAPESQPGPEPIEDVAPEAVNPNGFVSQNPVQSIVTPSLDGGIPHTTRHTESIPCPPSRDHSCQVD